MPPGERVVDGATAALCPAEIVKLLQEPGSMASFRFAGQSDRLNAKAAKGSKAEEHAPSEPRA